MSLVVARRTGVIYMLSVTVLSAAAVGTVSIQSASGWEPSRGRCMETSSGNVHMAACNTGARKQGVRCTRPVSCVCVLTRSVRDGAVVLDTNWSDEDEGGRPVSHYEW